MQSLLNDVRYAFRLLLKDPGFTAVVLITLALGIGANTAIFSVVNAVLLQPLPFKDQDRLVMVWEKNYKRGGGSHGVGRNSVGPANYIRWKERQQVFDQMSAIATFPTNLTGEGEPERVPSAYVSANLLSTLGVRPIVGRIFVPEDDERGKDTAVLISEGFWKRRFGSDLQVLGKKVILDGRPKTIVGVVPERMAFPDGVDIWSSYPMGPEFRDSHGRYMQAVAHLRPGVTLQQAQGEMERIARDLEKENPDFDTGWSVNLVPLREQLVGSVRRPLIVLLGAVVFVLLIACVNIANLLLARSAAREKEISIRSALGVRRGRLIRQLLTESVLLSLVGGVLGVLVGNWMLSALLKLVPSDIPAFASIQINSQVLGFTLGLAVLTGLLFGIAPGLRASNLHPVESLKEGGRGGISSRSHHGLRNGLVIAEAAITVVLLVGAGLLLKSFMRLVDVDPGFDARQVLVADLQRTADRRDPTGAKAVPFFEEVVRRLQALPQVKSVGAVSWLPLDSIGSATSFTVDDRPQPPAGELPVADVRSITADYFRAIGTPILRGRAFNSEDRAEDKVKKVIINETMVRTFWPGQDPIGKRISMEWFEMLHAEVIGVVPDTKLVSLNGSTRSQIYWFLPQFPYTFMTVVMRTSGDPQALVAPLRATVASVDPTQPVARIRTMEDVVATSVKQPRFLFTLVGCFALLALLLAAVGIYGVLSYSVTQRTPEIGIRMALGASKQEVSRMVVSEGMRLMLIGAAVGLVASLGLTQFLRALLFNIKATDPVTLLEMAALLGVIALLAVYLPARRAARVDPMVALRYE